MKQRRAAPRKSVNREAFLAELVPGEYVVHIEHGIARFAGLVHREVDGAGARVPRAALRGRRQALRADGPARPRQPLHRPAERASPTLTRLGTQRVGAREGARAAGGAGAGGGPARALRRARGDAGLRLPAGHGLADRARGVVPVRRDAGPDGGDPRRQARHGDAAADGPPDLRRRRLRQDGGRRCARRSRR